MLWSARILFDEWNSALQMFHSNDMSFYHREELYMNKTYSMSIRVSQEELDKLKQVAKKKKRILLIVNL